MGVVMTPGQTALASIDRARVEIGRVRGWTKHGAHDRAAQALDAALHALAEADTVLHAAPCAAVAACLTAIRIDLDCLTGA